MNGVHDMGGMDGFGKVEPEPNEPPFHADVGRPGARDAAGDGLRRRLEHRHVALRAGDAAAARLPRGVLLRALGAGHGEDAARARPDRRRRDRRRPRAASGQDRCSAAVRRRTIVDAVHDARLLRPAEPAAARPLQARRPRAHEEHQPADAHAAAALCARPCRHDRAVRGCHVFPDSVTTGAARIRSGSTRSCSTAASSGARTPIRR